jgi:putative ABC transport system permease protein
MLLHLLGVLYVRSVRNPLTTLAKVATLGGGLACFISVYGLSAFWSDADRHFANAERIFVISSTRVNDTIGSLRSPATSRHVAEYLRTDFPQLEAVARLTPLSERGLRMPVAAADRSARLFVVAADPEFLDVFDLPFVNGDSKSLRQPRSAIVTKETAQRLFGGSGALGARLLVANGVEVVVTGVVDRIPEPSHLGRFAAAVAFDVIVSSDVYDELRGSADSTPGEWLLADAVTYVLLPADGSYTATDLGVRLDSFVTRHVPSEQLATTHLALELVPLPRALSRFVNNGALSQVGLTPGTLLLAIGALALLVACLNFANLATADALSRAREIGLRKALGATRFQVTRQHLLEVGALASASIVAALVLVALLAPTVERAFGIDLRATLFVRPATWPFLAAVLLVTTLTGGIYPSMVIARTRPSAALQGANPRMRPRRLSSVLTGAQFAAATFLVIAAIVIYQQNHHLEGRSQGADAHRLLVIENVPAETKLEQGALHDALSALPRVEAVTAMNPRPWASNAGVLRIARTADASSATTTSLFFAVANDFSAALDMPPIAGRALDDARDGGPGNRPEDFVPRSMVIDRSLSAALGFASPVDAIGATVYVHSQNFSGGDTPSPREVVGVVEDKPLTVFSVIGRRPIAYQYYPSRMLTTNVVRISNADVAGTLERIDALWRSRVPGVPIDRRFADDDFERSLGFFATVSQVFIALAVATLAIAIIGLLAMASVATSRRVAEVGIRKVLGAETQQMVLMLLASISRPVIVASLVAWPLAYLVARVYLGAFLEPVALTPIPFLLGLASTLGVAGAVVLGKTLRAARISPAEVLRHE